MTLETNQAIERRDQPFNRMSYFYELNKDTMISTNYLKAYCYITN